jgi:hypothetical protein
MEIKRMWILKCMVKLVIIGANGRDTKGLKNNLENIPGEYSTDSLQKTAILGSSRIEGKYHTLKLEARQ